MFDSGWKPLLVYKSTDPSKYEMIADLLEQYPGGFIIVDVDWGPTKFSSFDELASFIADTVGRSRISGYKTWRDLEGLTMHHDPLISAELYNSLMDTVVDKLINDDTDRNTRQVIGNIYLPDWFIPVYKIRKLHKEPLEVNSTPRHLR